jgi:hypothetical protein
MSIVVFKHYDEWGELGRVYQKNCDKKIDV